MIYDNTYYFISVAAASMTTRRWDIRVRLLKIHFVINRLDIQNRKVYVRKHYKSTFKFESTGKLYMEFYRISVV